MRKLGIAMSIIGAAAFAALLAWGLTSSGVQAEEGPCALAGPPIPAFYEGLVTVDGEAAPAGMTLTFSYGGRNWATATVTAGLTGGPVEGSPNAYSVQIDEPNPQQYAEAPCVPGAPMTVTCGDTGATDTNYQYTPGGFGRLDIACTGAVTTATPTVTATATAKATATPTVTVTATPTATPKAPPVVGMGGMSSDGGFTWWPLALAAAALTSVAGLFTARWARR